MIGVFRGVLCKSKSRNIDFANFAAAEAAQLWRRLGRCAVTAGTRLSRAWARRRDFARRTIECHDGPKSLTCMGSPRQRLQTALSHPIRLAHQIPHQAAASLETRVLVSARRFNELGAADLTKEMETLESIEVIPRHVKRANLERACQPLRTLQPVCVPKTSSVLIR
jgi:hypothetical protein